MKRRKVIISPEARADLLELERWLLSVASTRTAEGYIARLISFCDRLETASERGRQRSDLRNRLRVIGFERRITVAFRVDDDRVDVLRFFPGGRDWESELAGD